MDFYIVETTADVIEPLAIYETFNEATENVAKFTAIYPDGIIEVMSSEEFIIASGR